MANKCKRFAKAVVSNVRNPVIKKRVCESLRRRSVQAAIQKLALLVLRTFGS
jgi:hypothetical protein